MSVAPQSERLPDRASLALEIVRAPKNDCDRFRKGIPVRRVTRQHLFGLPGAVGHGEGGRNAIGIEAVQIAAGWQNGRRSHQIAADHRGDQTPVKRPEQSGNLEVLGEQAVQSGEVFKGPPRFPRLRRAAGVDRLFDRSASDKRAHRGAHLR